MKETELNSLKTSLKNENPEMRADTILALNCSLYDQKDPKEYYREYHQAIPILTEALADSDNYVRIVAAEKLVAIDRTFQEANAFHVVKTLIEIIASQDETVVYEDENDIDIGCLTVLECAYYTLGDIIFLVDNTVAEIVQLFANRDPEYRKAVTCALSQIIYGNAPVWIQALESDNKLIRLGVIYMLGDLYDYGDLYDDMEAVVPALNKLSEDQDRQVSKAASKLLKFLKRMDVIENY